MATYPIDPFLLFGDFNLPKIVWSKPNLVSNNKEGDLVNFCVNHGLQQINTCCTRLNSLLDLVIVNDILLISNISCDVPFGTSDHDSLVIDVCVCLNSSDIDEQDNSTPITNVVTKNDNCVRAYSWKVADWNGFENYCTDINWPEILEKCANADELWLTFSMTLCHGRDLFVPLQKHNRPSNNSTVKKSRSLVL